jgi:hypothetical protein
MTPFRWTLLVIAILAGVVWGGAELFRWLAEPGPNYNRVDESLVIGGYVAAPPSGTRAVINLDAEPDPYACEVSIQEPIRDGEPAPELDWLRKMVRQLDEQRTAGRPTYLHCTHGVSRTGLVATAYFMWKEGWTRDEALAWLRQRRSNLQPNTAFMQRLLEWEEECRPPTPSGPAGE